MIKATLIIECDSCHITFEYVEYPSIADAIYIAVTKDKWELKEKHYCSGCASGKLLP